MRTLVHLSDLHFGRVDESLLQPLVDSVNAIGPNVVVVSGDLTQRAREAQFIEARTFLSRMPSPKVIVPGNHDVPLYNVVDRLFRPLTRFRRLIESSLTPSFIDEEIAVLGVNTARSMVVKNGRISHHQVKALRETLCALRNEVVKVVVTHHPFDVAPNIDHDELVGRAPLAMQMFAECGVDVLLAGHLHVSHSADSGDRYALAGYEALVVSAGTATSTRGRGEANSFNVLKLEKGRIDVQRWEWLPTAGRFEPASRQCFVRRERGWTPSDAPASAPGTAAPGESAAD